MPKTFLKILAILSGVAVLFYLLARKLSVWEIETVREMKRSVNGQASTKEPSVSGTTHSGQDDLKKIKGIGAVIAEKLHALGYHRYEQIANLSEEEKEHIEESLTFPGRIERDGWVEQARQLLS